QYCGALGKKANCQVAVSVHYVSPTGHYPLDLRLYLPDSWLTDAGCLDKAGVPRAERRPLTKPEVALELLDRVRAEGLPGGAAVLGGGGGPGGASGGAWGAGGWPWWGGWGGASAVSPGGRAGCRPGPATGGRPQTRPQLAEGSPPPVALGELARRVRLRRGGRGGGGQGKGVGGASPAGGRAGGGGGRGGGGGGAAGWGFVVGESARAGQ